MSGIALAQARVDLASERLDQIVLQQERRELARLEAEQAEQEREAAARARAHAERKRQFQETYADAYAGFNIEAPMPQVDELPSRFRRRLYDGLRRRLAPDHELSTVRADELAGSAEAFANFERDLLRAAKAEAKQPSPANLPASGEISRVVIDDDTGQKVTKFFSRQSFIADLSRRGQKVARIIDRKTGNVIWGAPMDRAS